jgi:hypothetical protein
LVELIEEDSYCPILTKVRIPEGSASPYGIDLTLPDGTVSGTLCDGLTGRLLDESGPEWMIWFKSAEWGKGGNVTGVWRTGSVLQLSGIPEGQYYISIEAKGFKEYRAGPFSHRGSGNTDLGIIRLERWD